MPCPSRRPENREGVDEAKDGTKSNQREAQQGVTLHGGHSQTCYAEEAFYLPIYRDVRDNDCIRYPSQASDRPNHEGGKEAEFALARVSPVGLPGC